MPPVNVEGDSEGEFFEYSEVEDLLCDRVQEYQQCDAVEEIVSVVELFEHAVTAGYSTPVGQRFVMEIAERCLAAQRIVPASEWDAARKRLLLQWHLLVNDVHVRFLCSLDQEKNAECSERVPYVSLDR